MLWRLAKEITWTRVIFKKSREWWSEIKNKKSSRLSKQGWSDFCKGGKLTIIPSITAVKPQSVIFLLILRNPLLIANHFFYTYLWVCMRIRHECQCLFPWQIKQPDIAKLLSLYRSSVWWQRLSHITTY